MNTMNTTNTTNSSNYEDTKTSAENHEMGRVGLTPNQEKPESLDWSVCENTAREAPKTARDKRLRVRICVVAHFECRRIQIIMQNMTMT